MSVGEINRAQRGNGIENPEHRRAFEAANDLLAETESGRHVAEHLASDRVDVRLYADEEFAARFPGSGGFYQPATQTMHLPVGGLGNAREAATLLAHEGQHAIDGGSRSSHAFNVAKSVLLGGVWDATRAAARFENPLTGAIDGFTGRSNEWEVDGYRVQAKVARELGLNQGAWAMGQNPDGTVRSDDEIRQAVAEHPLYRPAVRERLLVGSAVGLVGTLGTAYATRKIAGLVAPGSFLARHQWPVLLASAATIGSLLYLDHRTASARERGD